LGQTRSREKREKKSVEESERGIRKRPLSIIPGGGPEGRGGRTRLNSRRNIRNGAEAQRRKNGGKKERKAQREERG